MSIITQALAIRIMCVWFGLFQVVLVIQVVRLFEVGKLKSPSRFFFLPGTIPFHRVCQILPRHVVSRGPENTLNRKETRLQPVSLRDSVRLKMPI
jgi:hypothetical protein